MTLPADSHVHSEFSWDAAFGSMERTCEQAVRIGLPALAFTEHVDRASWPVPVDGPYATEHLSSLAGPDGLLVVPPFDVPGYLAAIDRCRHRFPELHILTGLEMGEPHRHAAAFAEVLAAGDFDRVLGSLHCLPDGDHTNEPWALYPHREASGVLREYLAEIPVLVAASDAFSVLAHIDYAVRFWPGEFDPDAYEEEFRHALRATAVAGKALEINTRIPLHDTLLTWWREEGGTAVSFGSDAHVPEALATGFREAAGMAEAHGFRPGRHPYDLWTIRRAV